MMFKFKFILLGVLITYFSTVMPMANALKATGYSKYGYDSNSETWRVGANCSSSRDARILVSQDKDGPWCAEQLPTLCDKTILKAVNKICSGTFKRNVTEYVEQQRLIQEKEDAEKLRASLLADLDSIQKMKNDINARKQFLNTRIQELNKRDNEIEQQIISLDRS